MRRKAPFSDKILVCLQDGPRGFAQLVAETRSPNTPTLSRSLKRLCAEGRITRTVLTEVRPPRVLYALAQQATE
jgi:DNA-binding HxlR family transcriptional regulator